VSARTLVALGAGTALLAAAVPALAATRMVKVGDDYFVRSGVSPTVEVRRATRVVWSFHGDRPHNVKAVAGPARFASPTMRHGTYSRKLTRRGTYSLVCTLHRGMRMRLRVT
jgi:plastocyanin